MISRQRKGTVWVIPGTPDPYSFYGESYGVLKGKYGVHAVQVHWFVGPVWPSYLSFFPYSSHTIVVIMNTWSRTNRNRLSPRVGLFIGWHSSGPLQTAPGPSGAIQTFSGSTVSSVLYFTHCNELISLFSIPSHCPRTDTRTHKWWNNPTEGFNFN